jgi:hypothetical protein
METEAFNSFRDQLGNNFNINHLGTTGFDSVLTSF